MTSGRAASSLVRRGILCGRPAPEPSAADDAGHGGEVFHGLDDCVARLVAVCGAEPEPGVAFGIPWPVLRIGEDALVAPALPVVGIPGETVAGDAVYHRQGATIRRESAGRPTPFLHWGSTVPAAVSGAAVCPFDLLWFGAAERYLLRGPRLEISDLHACLSLDATPAVLDRLLVRARRAPASILHGHQGATRSIHPAVIELHRHRNLLPLTDLADVESFLATGADVVGCVERGDRLVVSRDGGDELTLRPTHRRDGWTLALAAGQWPYQELTLDWDGDWVRVAAEIHPSLDPLAPGMRGRLSFDLLADLVAWGRGD